MDITWACLHTYDDMDFALLLLVGRLLSKHYIVD